MSLRKLWPRRALFYTPGSDLRKLSKIEKLVGVSAPDFVAVDIEDGVAMMAKEGVLFYDVIKSFMRLMTSYFEK